MGYFSNGSEGERYELWVCQNCVHFTNCPVWLLHMLYNYDDDKQEILDLFIPRAVILNDVCTMFWPIDDNAKRKVEDYRDWVNTKVEES